MFNHKLPSEFPMQTLRKKTSPSKFKNDPSRFLGEGLPFRAKLIGVLEVPEARGDRMCQEALADLKMAIRAAGEHKQRITVHVAIDGLRLRDDKTGDSLYHHPVHKISFIAQDMQDSRAFGYIFGSPDTGHRFFGIKTDKAASNVVMAMRDLFQVVFELKKREIELAKQQIEAKSVLSVQRHISTITSDIKAKSTLLGESSSKPSEAGVDASIGGGVAELVDLEQELSSLRRGLTQVEELAPPPAAGDPFGDSFTPPAQKGLIPPPPTGSSTRGRSTPSTTASQSRAIFSPSKTSAATLPFDLTTAPSELEPVVSASVADTLRPTSPVSSQSGAAAVNYDIFTDLDPLGTGRNKPYVDKKLFFQELKNPPKKVLKDLVPTTNTSSLLSEVLAAVDTKVDSYHPPTSMTSLTRHSGGSVTVVKQPSTTYTSSYFSSDPFAETDPFDTPDPFSDPFKEDPFTNLQEFSQSIKSKLRETCMERGGEERNLDGKRGVFNGPLQVTLPPEPTPKSPRLQRQGSDSSSIRQRPHRSGRVGASIPVLGGGEAASPPPLPPKKVGDVTSGRAPPRPPLEDDGEGPPLPPPSRKKEPLADRSIKPLLTAASTGANSSEEEYLSPAPPPLPTGKRFDITLAQLLTCNMQDLSLRLHVPVDTLSSMTLPQLTSYLRSYLAADTDRTHIHIDPTIPVQTQTVPENVSLTASPKTSTIKTKTLPLPSKPNKESKTNQFESNFTTTETNGTFVANFDDFEKKSNPTYDRYAAFREIQEKELIANLIIDPLEDSKKNGDHNEDSEKEESLTELVKDNFIDRQESRSPLKSLDDLTIDSFNMFRKTASPNPTQIDSKIEDVKNVMKNLQIEQARRSVSPRETVTFADIKTDDSTDRYAALREITITEPQDEFESIPSEPKPRKRSDEKSDGFDNSDFFDCIDNSSLSYSHVEDAFRRSPSVREAEARKVVTLQEPVMPPSPPRVSVGSLSDVNSASSPDIKESCHSSRAGRRSRTPRSWSGRASPSPASPSSDSSPPPPRRRRRTPARTRQTSSSSRDVSPWEEEPPSRHHRAPSHHRDSRHNSSAGSRECVDSGSGRDKDKLRDKRVRERDSRDPSTRELCRRSTSSKRDRDRNRDVWDRDRDRDYSRDKYRSRERLKDYRDKERDRDRHRLTRDHSWDDDDGYSDNGESGRSSPRERWSEHGRWRRDDRNYGSLSYRESRRRNDSRQSEEGSERSERSRYASTLSRSSRRQGGGGGGGGGGTESRREQDKRRARRDEPRHRSREQRFSTEFSPRDPSPPFETEFPGTPASGAGGGSGKKRQPYSSLEGTRFAFEPEETTASPLSGSSARARDGDSPATRFRFDSDSVSPRSLFEDDFCLATTPRHRAPSIAEEEEVDQPAPLRTKPTKEHKDIKKSESVNIFVRESDPFENDDFFACTGSDRAARRENWPGDFQAFDQV